MGQRYLGGLTAAQKTELWGRWQRGESLKAIGGRVFGKPSSLIYCLVSAHGGIRPAERRRSSCRPSRRRAKIILKVEMRRIPACRAIRAI